MVGSKGRKSVIDSVLMKYGSDSLSWNRLWKIEDVVNVIKETSRVKFDESIDINIRLNFKKKKLDSAIRGVVELPYGNGKKKKILALCAPGDEEVCLGAGAAYAGTAEYVDRISQGFSDFTTVVAVPAVLVQIARVSRFLGSKGLMPNTKSGTVSTDIVGVIKRILKGQIEYKSEDNGIIQSSIGRVSFESSRIVDNVVAFLHALSKQNGSNNINFSIKSVKMSSTMGLSFFVNFSDILNRV